jgi:hypothetical protein
VIIPDSLHRVFGKPELAAVIERAKELTIRQDLLKRHPVVGIIGARQVGKTTLARAPVSKRHQTVTYYVHPFIPPRPLEICCICI